MRLPRLKRRTKPDRPERAAPAPVVEGTVESKPGVRRMLHQLFEFWVRLRPARVTLGVRGLVVDHKGRVCLVRHTYRDGWFLPGGGVKTREALVEAVARELREETGVVVAETPQNVLGVYSSRHGNRSDHIVVFVVTDWRVEESVSPEIAEVAFFPPGELPPGTTPGTSRRISEWMTGVPPGHRW